MKRYDIEAYCRVCDCEIATKKRPSEDGDYYLVTDVTRTMIPRPDPDEARKAQEAVLAIASRLTALERTVKDYKEAVDAITAWADGKDRQAYEKAITEIPDNPDRAEIVERYYTRLLSVEHTRTQLTKILNDLIDEVTK